MIKEIAINNRRIGPGQPCYIIAEVSANHNQEFSKAKKLVMLAKQAGADAAKLQTYTADTITLNCDNKYFQIKDGPWKGQTLYELYQQAYTPWEWQEQLKKYADEIGITLFSSPFDKTAVDFLEQINVPAYKIASFELLDIPLVKYIASKGKPVIISTGMATLGEIDEAVQAIRNAGGKQISLLKCTSAYPAPPEESNLLTISHMAQAFDVPVGLSDHTLGIAVSVTAVALGASIIEKHFTLSRDIPSPDSTFSLEPNEFKEMVDAIRTAEKAIGNVNYGIRSKKKPAIYLEGHSLL